VPVLCRGCRAYVHVLDYTTCARCVNEQLYSRHRQSDRSHGKRGASAPHRRLVRTTTGAACHDRFTSRVPTSR